MLVRQVLGVLAACALAAGCSTDGEGGGGTCSAEAKQDLCCCQGDLAGDLQCTDGKWACSSGFGLFSGTDCSGFPCGGPCSIACPPDPADTSDTGADVSEPPDAPDVPTPPADPGPPPPQDIAPDPGPPPPSEDVGVDAGPPPPPPDTTTTTHEAFALNYSKSGGFAGWTTTIDVTAAGELSITASGPNAGTCSDAPLTEAQLTTLGDAAAAVSWDEVLPSYKSKDNPFCCCDQFVTDLSVTLAADSPAPKPFHTDWCDESEAALPAELSAFRNAVESVGAEVLAACP